MTRTESLGHLKLDGRRIPCLLRRSSARRSLAMRVAIDGQVVVLAPRCLPDLQIEDFIQRHADWLRRQLNRLSAFGDPWREGGRQPDLGRSRPFARAEGLVAPHAGGR